MYDYLKNRNVSDPEKAEALAHAFLDLLRLNLMINSMDSNCPETDEDRYEKFVLQAKAAEEELFYRFKNATGRQMYRVGSELFVDGVSV